MSARNDPSANKAPSARKTPERRRYYRIRDRVGLEYRPIAPDSAPPSAAACFDGSATLALQEELHKAELEIRAQLNALAESDRRLVQVLTLMNQKLNTMARIMAFQQKPLQDDQWQEVVLSEGGLSFYCQDVTWQAGDTLAVRLTLAPALNQVALFGEVVAADPQEVASPGCVQLEFRDLEDDSRQQIARHVLQLQARQRQQKRSEPD